MPRYMYISGPCMQALGCADSGASLISPFVGRILDWYKAKEGRDFAPEEDPGVLSVRRIYWYYKRHGITTDVMGASFRNVGEVQQLSGCDKLTVAPALLGELAALDGALPRVLSPEAAAENCEDEVRFVPCAVRVLCAYVRGCSALWSVCSQHSWRRVCVSCADCVIG